MSALTRFVLDHKRLVLGFWLMVTLAAFAAVGPAARLLRVEPSRVAPDVPLAPPAPVV